ncbi:uncharacterized protein LOC124813941 [Hydra vulgaris]|uniref:uncharacterized protein LOC124813941 n=1 Tax=Hydra vulgaris TaxID=6087 RepID=UPI0032E9D725
MPLFKIWSGDRLVKKAIIAENFDMLVVKVLEKFQFSPAKIVLNIDGTEIEETDVLLSLSGEVLLALRDGEDWELCSKLLLLRVL